MSTENTIKALCALDEAPWAELRGNPINARGLAALLGPYGIKSKKVRLGDVARQGHRREDLWDAWQRYLPSPREPEQPELAEHAATVPDVPHVPLLLGEEQERGRTT